MTKVAYKLFDEVALVDHQMDLHRGKQSCKYLLGKFKATGGFVLCCRIKGEQAIGFQAPTVRISIGMLNYVNITIFVLELVSDSHHGYVVSSNLTNPYNV